MPLIFPSSPTLGQTYSSGSSAIYQWDGSHWDLKTVSSPPVMVALTASLADTASFSNPNTPYLINKKVYNINSPEVIKNFTLGSGFSDGTLYFRYDSTAPKPTAIIVTVDVDLEISGSGADIWATQIGVSLNSSSFQTMQNRVDIWENVVGGGAYGGMTLNPISGRYDNAVFNTLYFSCRWFASGSSGDLLTIHNRTSLPSGMISIEEINTPT
jgi:hypothetical protein